MTDEKYQFLTISESHWLRQKAEYCISLYNAGLEFPRWSKERADLWFESEIYFVDHFLRPELPRPSFHDDWYYWAVSEQSYLNLSPRDHAKTTVHGVNRVVWEICCNRNITFFIIFSTTDVSKLVLTQIKSHLTQNPFIRDGFGVFNPADLPPEERMVDQDWSQGSITVNRSDYQLKDPTVGVAGALTNVLSRRTHRLFVDDLLTDKIAFSEAESERVVRWYFNDVQPILLASGQEIITGTSYRKGDFYDTIRTMKDDNQIPVYKTFVGDAIVDEEKQITLWPERWNYPDLMRQRAKMGSVRFNRNYRNRTSSDEDSPFPMIWFKGGLDKATGIIHPGCYNTMYTLGDRRFRGRGFIRVSAIGVDPAIGQSSKAKFFAAVVLGVSIDGYLVVMDIMHGKLKFPVQKRALAGLYDRYQSRYVVVENNAYQQALVEGMGEDSPKIPVIGLQSSNFPGSIPDIGVQSMDVYFETGRVLLPDGDGNSKELTGRLVEELHNWGQHNTSDIAMALWMAYRRLKPMIDRYSALPDPADLIHGDRVRYQRQKIQGLSGLPLPRLAVQMIKERSLASAPFSNLSPVSRRQK